MSPRNIQLNISQQSDCKDFNIISCIPLKGMIITVEHTLLYSM